MYGFIQILESVVLVPDIHVQRSKENRSNVTASAILLNQSRGGAGVSRECLNVG